MFLLVLVQVNTKKVNFAARRGIYYIMLTQHKLPESILFGNAARVNLFDRCKSNREKEFKVDRDNGLTKLTTRNKIYITYLSTVSNLGHT